GRQLLAGLDARDYQYRYVAHVLRQRRDAVADATLNRCTLWIVTEQSSRRCAGGEVLLGDFAVDLADAATDRSIVYDDPLPALAVGSGGRLKGNVEALANQAHRYRTVEIEAPAHAAGGRQKLVGR